MEGGGWLVGGWKVESGGWGVITRVGIYIHVYTYLVTMVIGNPTLYCTCTNIHNVCTCTCVSCVIQCACSYNQFLYANSCT